MKSTRLRTLQSVRNRNQSSTEGQTETTRSRNRRSSIREEVDEEDSINGLDRDKESVTQETETDNALLTARERNSKENRADSGNKKTGNPQQNDLNAASWEDKVYDFLASNQAGMLDEDEVVSRMNRMVRSATQQFHAAKSLMNSAVSDAIVFDSCYEEAQDQAVIDDILKDLFGSFTSLDRRAVSWIKRTIGASGRRQKSKHNLLLGNTKRRLTRGMAKTSNGTKDEHILFDAVREIEREKDMPRRSERRLSASSYNADDEGNRHKSARHKRRLGDDQSVRHYTLYTSKVFHDSKFIIDRQPLLRSCNDAMDLSCASLVQLGILSLIFPLLNLTDKRYLKNGIKRPIMKAVLNRLWNGPRKDYHQNTDRWELCTVFRVGMTFRNIPETLTNPKLTYY